jgi:hypothetical protein
MMVDRLIAPRSKLGFVRAVDEETATTSLGALDRQFPRCRPAQLSVRFCGRPFSSR